jgi:hypothetical protein
MRQRACLLVPSVKVLALYVNESIRMYLVCNSDFCINRHDRKRDGSAQQPPERAAADVTAEIGKVTAYIRPELDAAEMGWTRLNVWLSGPAS